MRKAIRRVWSIYSAERSDILYEAKRIKKRRKKDGSLSSRPNIFYTCAGCQGEFKTTEVHVDHIDPVGKTPEFPPDGKYTWDKWLDRLFCNISNLQVLCKDCHKDKTKRERAVS